MSSLPPGPPPSDPPAGPPPSGPPPGAEVLERGGGGPIPPTHDPAAPGGGRRRWWLAAGAVVGLGAVGGAAFGAWWYLSTGPQPAEALPAGTLGYVSIDLDPSGEQKLDALRTLRKFPAIDEELDLSGDVSEIDVKQTIVEKALESAPCDLDYGDDVAPWLGDRAAVAAVDLGGDEPAPVFVLQVSDPDAAEDGLATLFSCGGSEESDRPGLEVTGDWAVLAETQDTVDDVVARTEDDGPLADDDTFTEWVDAAGDPGIVTMYAAPEAGAYLAENLGGLFLGGGEQYASSGSYSGEPISSEVPDEVTEALEDFEGAAVTVRFDGGALEVEVAGDPGLSGDGLYAGDGGAEALSTLPGDTAAAVGIGFEDGWFDEAVASVAASLGEDAETLVEELEQESGLALPEDAETLVGDSAVLSIGGDFDPETFLDSQDGSDVPVALKVLGDPEAIEEVLDKVRPRLGGDDLVLASSTEGDAIAVGPNEDYREEVLAGGDLADAGSFDDVVPEQDAAAVLYVDVDKVTGPLLEAIGHDDALAANLGPLAALGMSAWEDDGVAHSLLRITTD